MSRENVEAVQLFLASLATRDGVTFSKLLHRDVEWHNASDEPDAGVHKGLAGIQELLEGWAETFDDFQGDPLEFIDAGELVIVPLRISGRLRGASEPVEIDETHVYRFDAGRIVDVHEYRTKDEALQAAGLS